MMDETSFWKAAANWLWVAILPLLKWIWDRQGKDIQEVKDGLHSLKNRVVSLDAMKDRKEEVDRSLEARRTGERDLHERLNDHIEQDGKTHNAIMETLGQIRASVARIEGRLGVKE